MSVLGKRSRELVNNYGLSLELRVDRGDGSLVCRDEDLWKQAEGLLVEGNALDTHSLGLDPLKVIEESLTTDVLPPQGTEGRPRGGLRGLVKAFEVLELAALNLYLGPWRKEYKVVKMYSGLFTHYIKPVLSMPQIVELFGLLGYQPCSGRYEQLRLQSVGFYNLDDLLHLACAFFLARCESLLLLSALGKRSGQPDWELSLVEERQRGHSIQVALDNTKRKLEVNQPLKEDVLELAGTMEDLDLYTAAEVNNVVQGGESSLSLAGRRGLSPPAAVAHSNGLSSPSASSPREPVCVSTFNYQLSMTSPGGPSGSRNVSATTRQSRSPYEDPLQRGHAGEDSNARGTTPQASAFGKGESQWRGALSADDDATGKTEESKAVPQRALGDRGASVPSLDVKGNTALSSSHDASDPEGHGTQPIPYHDCCDLAQPDPRFICRDCWVFHSSTCKGLAFCREKRHKVQRLGVCACGKECSRIPLVLCRYCGTEYCNPCWYRRPVVCFCGRTFDQSSAV